MTKTVSAYEARTKLGELMNLVYYKNIDIIVEKMGKPIVKITKIDEKSTGESYRDKIVRFAGAFSDKDAEIIRKYATKLRKEAKIIPNR